MTVVLVSASLALAGCQDEAESAGSAPAATPTVVTGTATASSTSSPTGTATATASVDPAALAAVPKAARAHTYPGAQAFAEFYLSQLNKAWSRPDPEAIRPYATSACKTCTNFLDSASGLLERHERYDGPVVDVDAAAYLPESTRSRVLVSVVAYQQKVAIVASDGSIVHQLKREPSVMEMDIIWRTGSWVVDKSVLVKAHK